MLPITRFSDYRAYLVAYAQDRKTESYRWTYGVWARKLGLKTTSSLTKIIQGKRNPGPDVTEKLVRYFRFTNTDADYFRDLIQLHKVKHDPRLSVVLLERLQGESSANGVRFLDDKTFSVISEWYCYAIREMVQMDHFFEDPLWISGQMRFKVTPRQAKKAIDDLLSIGLLRRDGKGRLQLADARVDTTHDVASEAIKRNHEQTLENAKESIRSVEVREREFTGVTFPMNRARLPEAKEAIRRFRRRFSRSFESRQGDAIYQFHLCLFPLTKGSPSPTEGDLS